MRPEAVVELAAAHGLTIATAESLTGGAVASTLVSVPGASAVVLGGVVAYTAAVKVDVLGVDRALIAAHGVVSEEVALAMARRAAALFGADLAVSTTGVAGPEPHDGKVPGTVCLASVGQGGEMATTEAFEGDRVAVRAATVRRALELLELAARGDFSHGVTGVEHN